MTRLRAFLRKTLREEIMRYLKRELFSRLIKREIVTGIFITLLSVMTKLWINASFREMPSIERALDDLLPSLIHIKLRQPQDSREGLKTRTPLRIKARVSDTDELRKRETTYLL